MTAPLRTDRARPRVHPWVDLVAAYSWRLLLILAAAVPVVWLLNELFVVVLPVIIATFITVLLAPPARALRRLGLHNGIAAFVSLIGFLAVLTLAGWIIAPPVADEFAELPPTISKGIDNLERWLVEDAPIDVSRSQLESLREQAENAVADWLRSSGGLLIRRAVAALEIVAGTILALIVAFFLVKDGNRLQEVALSHIPRDRHTLARRVASRAWTTLSGYLKGSAALGTLEAIIIGTTLAIVGANLVIPVMVLTFLAAFVPLVGAIVAGVLAVLIALVTAGAPQAAIVAIVAVVVQQFDNDLLAPLVFGKALRLHPLVIILSVASGAALVGPMGAVLAVPTVAVTINVIDEARATVNGDSDDDSPASSDSDADGAD